ncbi:Tannase/feruloyl esterase [Hypoxylon trugodes]|uniref:Tannase/feruloyl esterase n=1 Tax=Hypoxylon trugodes TaxID=326681 RepID=UPI00218EA9C4|nr:Tannase/feruloyl esterase [Hypoxylon trugodes]KAI1393188.1 Tannase/feruloyl esterase [Hypoxylon trugodes]
MNSSLVAACNAASFNPSIFGGEILSVEANLVSNYSANAPDAFRYVAPSVQLKNASFCNITVSYTHPGQGDNIIIESWFPVSNWNGRFQAVGGGGWVAGRFAISYGAMVGALADGFATTTTDAGLGAAPDANPWALDSPGNVNLYNLQNLGSVSLNDQALIGKALISSFYGRAPEYSYWTGCSQGGQQGLMIAQRYPTAYDGIIAGAPAIYWTEMLPSLQWSQQVMAELDYYPYGCEIDAITAAAISACDNLDGVVDDVIACPDSCLATFNPFSVVGQNVKCTQTNGTEVRISEEAAIVVNSTWNGMTMRNGKQIWYGLNPGSDLTGDSPGIDKQPGVAATTCNETGCVGVPSSLGLQWIQLFVARNPDKDCTNLTRTGFDDLAHAGIQQYSSIIGTTDPDLSRFQEVGGKIISFHGLADNVIPTKGTEQYYNRVFDLLPNVHDFYRYYEVPGLSHCFGGASGQPDQLFSQLRNWVENGTAPESSPVKLTVAEKTHDRILCPYLQVARLNPACGDAAKASCWSCVGPRTSESTLDEI